MATVLDQVGAELERGIKLGVNRYAEAGVRGQLTTEWLPPITFKAAKDPTTDPTGESLGALGMRLLRPHLHLELPGNVPVDWAPAGRPQASRWPLLAAGLVGVLVLAVIGARSLLK